MKLCVFNKGFWIVGSMLLVNLLKGVVCFIGLVFGIGE